MCFSQPWKKSDQGEESSQHQRAHASSRAGAFSPPGSGPAARPGHPPGRAPGAGLAAGSAAGDAGAAGRGPYDRQGLTDSCEKKTKNFRKHRGGWRSLVGKRGEKPGERRRPYFPPKCYLLPLPAKVTSKPGADVKTKATGLIYSYQPGSLLLLKNQSLGFIVPAGKAPVERVVTQTAGRRKKERTLLSGERRAGLP